MIFRVSRVSNNSDLPQFDTDEEYEKYYNNYTETPPAQPYKGTYFSSTESAWFVKFSTTEKLAAFCYKIAKEENCEVIIEFRLTTPNILIVDDWLD